MNSRSDTSLVPEPPARALQACVIVPVRDEEELLPSALQALAEQKQLNGAPLLYDSYEVILLINNTTDRSRQVAESFQRLYPALRLHIAERILDASRAHIGYVRRLLMDEACRRLETVADDTGLILSTDSDTRVAPNWIARNFDEIDRGADAVGGRIVVLPCDQDVLDPPAQSMYRYDHLYRRLVCWLEDRCDPEPYDPWPRHYQHFGASLAITPRAYKTAGRLPLRRHLEDVAFYDALLCRDIRLRHSNVVRVFTSGRIDGRTRLGLSAQLKGWQHSQRVSRVRVESARFLDHLFSTRRQLRRFWLDCRQSRTPVSELSHQLSAALGVPARRVIDSARNSRYFGLLLYNLKFYERCRAMWPDHLRLAKLVNVVDELQAAFAADLRSLTRGREIYAISAK
jgi:glycosyltransferase involved in cell wall biosynthesis